MTLSGVIIAISGDTLEEPVGISTESLLPFLAEEMEVEEKIQGIGQREILLIWKKNLKKILLQFKSGGGVQQGNRQD